jgi:8-oxo-dGTP pyrophosphatase MutT (NUDIX family)
MRRRNPWVDVGYVGEHYGTAGSGILYFHDIYILLLKRSGEVVSPYVWGVPGGAIPVDSRTGHPMDPLQSALKEAREEMGRLPPGGDAQPSDVHVAEDPISHFRYTTYSIELAEVAFFGWEPRLNWEHDDWGWFTVHEALMQLDLHPGVADMLSRS